jgi:hypothetical protein
MVALGFHMCFRLSLKVDEWVWVCVKTLGKSGFNDRFASGLHGRYLRGILILVGWSFSVVRYCVAEVR